MSKLIKPLLLLLYLAALALPLYVFVHDRGGFSALAGTSNFAGTWFPLFGLYAFSLVTIQVLLTSNSWWLRRYWPGVVAFHRIQGLVALLFIIIHPLLVWAAFGLTTVIHFNEVSPELRIWLIPAVIAWLTVMLTISVAVLAWRGVNIPWWYQVHRLNYLVFLLVWLHSWFVGTDVQSTGLKYVWITYLLLVVASFAGRYIIKPAYARR